MSKSKDIIVCPIHGNKKFGIKPTHFCRFKINGSCGCICACDKRMMVAVEIWSPKGIGKQETHYYAGSEYLFGVNGHVKNKRAAKIVEAVRKEINRLVK